MPSGEKKASANGKIITFDVVENRLQLRKPAVYAKIHKGVLSPVKVGGKLLFNLDEVEAEAERMRLASLEKKKRGRKRFQDPEERLSPAVNIEAVTTRTAVVAESKSSLTVDQAGLLASKATKLFSAGNGIREVVMELCIPYDLAKLLYQDYKSCGPEIWLPPQIVAELRYRLNWTENPPTPEGLVQAFREYEKNGDSSTKQPEGRAATDQKDLPVKDKGRNQILPSMADIDFGE